MKKLAILIVLSVCLSANAQISRTTYSNLIRNEESWRNWLGLGEANEPNFSSVILNSLTAERLIQTDPNKLLISTDLYDWITGGAGVSVADNGDGKVTVSATLGTSITSSEIVDGTIELVDMNNLNVFADEDIVTYETATGGGFQGMTVIELLALTDTDSLPEGSTNLYQDSEVTNWIDDVVLGSSGALTLTGNLIIPDAGYIGSASDTDAVQIEADGDIVLTQNLGIGITPVNPLTIKADGSNKIARFIETGAGAEYVDMEVLANGNLLFRNDAGAAILMLAESNGATTFGSETVVQAKLNVVGGANEELFRFKTTSTWLSLLPKTDDGMHWAENVVNNVTNGNLIFCHWTYRASDFDHDTESADTTIFQHSDTNPNTSNVKWGSMTFAGTGSGGGDWEFETGVGDICFNPAGNVVIGGTDAGTGAIGCLTLAAGTHPTTVAADSATFFVEDVVAGTAEMRVIDEGENESTLSPHNFSLFEPNDSYVYPWSYRAQNTIIGKEINVDMYGAIKAIEQITGKQFIYTRDVEQRPQRWQEKQAAAQTRAQLEQWVEITLAEAVEFHELTENTAIVDYEMHYGIDPNTGELVQNNSPIYGPEPTGEYEYRLKDDVRLDNDTGRVYRKKRLDEVVVDPSKFKELPEWMKKRTQLIR